MIFRVIEDKGLDRGLTKTLTAGTYSVGRSSDCDIRLKAPDVSRQHIKLEITDAGLTVEPYEGKKCLLDGEPLTGSVQVASGQRVTLGRNTVLRFEANEGAAPEDDDLLDDEEIEVRRRIRG